MDPVKVCLLSVVLLAMLSRAVLAAVGDACSDSVACGDPTNHVCDPATSTCKVMADEDKSSCEGSNDNCPANAACSTTICSCNDGYIEASGLCIVLGATCSSSIACGDADNYVCDTDTCKVKANTAATSCSGNDDCPTNAECDTNAKTCSCSSTYREVAGLCVAVIGSTCTTASECSTALTHTTCQIISPCAKGTCQCDTGYSGTDCLTLGNGKDCDSTDDKCDSSKTLECSSGKCACRTSGHTYKEKVGTCTNLKVFGETCSGSSDCYTTTNGGCNSDKCSCNAGYIEDPSSAVQSCRKPYRTETCVYGVGCGMVDLKGLLNSETSQVEPTCSATSTDAPGTCGCATSGQTMESAQKGSICYNYCLTTHTGATTADSQACTTHSQCTSKVCAQCPGDTAGKCYSAPCSNGSGMKKTERGMIMLSFILLLVFIF